MFIWGKGVGEVEGEVAQCGWMGPWEVILLMVGYLCAANRGRYFDKKIPKNGKNKLRRKN